MDQTETDMRMLMRQAGITLPEDRMAVMLESYRRWLGVVSILDEPLPYADEPAVAFHPEPGVK